MLNAIEVLSEKLLVPVPEESTSVTGKAQVVPAYVGTADICHF
jgi:hypothetical protein